MAEDQFGEQIIPGTYIRVQAEALISAGGISSGNIGIVGTAGEGTGSTRSLADYASAREAFGAYDAYAGGSGTLNLPRALEVLFRNGARSVYAYGLPVGATPPDYTTAFNELLKDNVNLLVAPELTTDNAKSVLGLVNAAESSGKDVIAVIGSDQTTAANVIAQVTENKRFILCTPGIQTYDAAAGAEVSLSGSYTAAAVAGLISSLAVQTSPTNKVLPGVTQLNQRYSYTDTAALVSGGVLALEDRRGIRVVRGITTDSGAFGQITTRRITDYAKAGIRQVSNPFIGRLNNERVRKAMQGAIDGFLATML
ncbi:MAG: phage tail sheath subtilisin-like domain-containing protein, partial [Desulfobacteraceae bacterium]|nr:phage tail sheath subtilisin-like domain-containing protein [Desulfobacteraceae bacterium]